MEYFSRSSVKQEAKELIKPDKRWLYNFFAGVVPFLLVSAINIRITINADDSFESVDPSAFVGLFSGSFLSFILALAILPIVVAYKGPYQLRCIRDTDYNVGFVYENAFSNYGKYFSTGFMKSLYLFLWACLLYIPACIKYYSYYFTYYIIGENPDLTANEAITLSRRMTNGHKWDLFVLDLSFIGWHLLSSIAFGIPYIWVNPYIETTKAMYYENYKKMAIDNNVINPSELGYVNVDNYERSNNSTSYSTTEPKNYVSGELEQQNIEKAQQEINNAKNIIEQQRQKIQKEQESLNNTQQTNNTENNSDKSNDNYAENLFEVGNKFDFTDKNKNNKDDDSNSNGFEV